MCKLFSVIVYHCVLLLFLFMHVSGIALCLLFSNEQEIRSVEVGVCPMLLFHLEQAQRDVHPVQNLLLCTKFHQNPMKKWRYNDFQNGGRPPSWNCFTTIRDYTRSLCCWPQLPVKFHVNVIHSSEDYSYLNFRIFGLKCLFRSPKWGLWGTLDP